MAVICLITQSQLSTNPRVVKEADALTEAGHRVVVICTRMAAWADETDREFADRAWRVQACVPLGPLERPPKRLYRALRRRIARVAYAAGVRHQRVAEAAWHEVTPTLVRAAQQVEADLYIAHYPAALPAAAKAAKVRGALYAYDAEDFHLGDPPDGDEHEPTRALTRVIEGRYLEGTAYVTAASPGIADAYVEAYGIVRPTVVLNVFPSANAPAVASARGTAEPGPSIYWFSQTIGADRGLECAVRALAIATARPHLYLRGRVASGFDTALQAVAEEAGVSGRIHFLAPATPSALERLAANYDLGLAAETGKTRNHRVALANKIFTYLLAGIPVLLSDIPAHRELSDGLGDAGRIFPVDDPAALARAIDSLLLDSAEAVAFRRRHAWELGQSTFNWDVEKAHLRSVVDGALSSTIVSAYPAPTVR